MGGGLSMQVIQNNADNARDILQSHIPFDLSARALPGVAPLPPDDWISVDDAFAAQMSYRQELIAEKKDAVLQLDPTALEAAQETLDLALTILKNDPARGYRIAGDSCTRPDGKTIALNRTDPLWSLGHLVQEDICILQKHGEEHVLTGALLCFPAGWRLDEKFLRPLTDIHVPVDSYDTRIAARVQRLFDGVQPGKPLWRFNKLWYANADLHQPRSIHDPRRPHRQRDRAAFFRCERQCIVRLPETRAVVFSIHTYVIRASQVPL